MTSVGIIAEFDPFHEGHRRLVREAKMALRADTVVCVMSGDFTQRGEPASSDKWNRAVRALEGGANLVLELPVLFACSSAAGFADGGIRILEGLGVDCLAFGSESGDLSLLERAAGLLRDRGQEIDAFAASAMKAGKPYPAAREEAVMRLEPGMDPSVFREPNNILALEYMRRIRTLQPFTLKRETGDHYASGTLLRRQMREREPDIYISREKILFALTASKILTAPAEKLDALASGGGGLGQKLKKEIRYADSIESLTDRVKSKAYTRTRIRRLLTEVLLGIQAGETASAPVYARILAADAEGRRYLKRVRGRDGIIPVLTNPGHEGQNYPEVRRPLELDFLASDLYNLICGRDLYRNSDYVSMPFMKK